MRVNPADTASVYAPLSHKCDNVDVSDDRRLVHLFVLRQEPCAPASVADKKLSIHEIMATDFVTAQQFLQFGGVRRPIREETDPDRSINEDNHAAECFTDEARSRRRGVSRARGSEPRSARRRSYAPATD